MQGILIVDKPMDWTSFDVVAKLRGVLGTRKLGHSGTLDPMATGVLPVFCGGASKAVDLQLNHDKSYRAVLKLGARTDTGDVTGTVLETAPVTAGEGELLAVLPQFIGPQMQVPPMYSAIKLNGQPLYKLAREGVTVERKARPIEIYSITYGGSPAENEYVLDVTCSKGTYCLLYTSRLLDGDEGSRSIGEVALVPASSPINRSGKLFYSTLFDENAACHIAFGASYPGTTKGGTALTKEEPVSYTHLNCLKADYARIFKSDVIVDLIKVMGCGVELGGKHNKEPVSYTHLLHHAENIGGTILIGP